MRDLRSRWSPAAIAHGLPRSEPPTRFRDRSPTTPLRSRIQISGRYAADSKAVVNPAGRGTIYNLGCYPASLLHLVMQTAFDDGAFQARSMWAAGTRSADGTIGEASLAVRFDNGVLANLWSTDEYGMSHDFVVMGEPC